MVASDAIEHAPTSEGLSARSLIVRRDAMRFRKPFRIAGYSFDGMPSIVAEIGSGGRSGRGEAAGVEKVREAIVAGIG